MNVLTTDNTEVLPIDFLIQMDLCQHADTLHVASMFRPCMIQVEICLGNGFSRAF